MFLREPIHIFVGGVVGITQYISQGEGGEQDDPLMPLLFALGQHGALEAIHERMRPGEHLMAFLDDIYTACRPERLDEVHTTVDEQLATHAHIHVHHGKTQVWNRGGVEPSGIEEMTRAARALKPEVVVWRGDPLLPATQQGVKVLGIPIGKHGVRAGVSGAQDEATASALPTHSLGQRHRNLRLLSMCGATRASF